jgi:hypothetical protein
MSGPQIRVIKNSDEIAYWDKLGVFDKMQSAKDE